MRLVDLMSRDQQLSNLHAAIGRSADREFRTRWTGVTTSPDADREYSRLGTIYRDYMNGTLARRAAAGTSSQGAFTRAMEAGGANQDGTFSEADFRVLTEFWTVLRNRHGQYFDRVSAASGVAAPTLPGTPSPDMPFGGGAGSPASGTPILGVPSSPGTNVAFPGTPPFVPPMPTPPPSGGIYLDETGNPEGPGDDGDATMARLIATIIRTAPNTVEFVLAVAQLIAILLSGPDASATGTAVQVRLSPTQLNRLINTVAIREGRSRDAIRRDMSMRLGPELSRSLGLGF